ncbi:uncharacterized protein LOC113748740 isoform X2 [Coffea eugenioides]|uniref:uncharacterized protein LOC113748740 isoform X2 n=1 Tax=Coffea eugenioides TaxID=49369 RepID=UPI000F615741|nr:uncharacterized protein LOC113748740 isoform X2 [Coffea eugenioides]
MVSDTNTNIFKRFRIGLLPWFRKKLLDPLLHILRMGAEPKQLAFSAALGITLGVFPICGVTFFLCGLAIALLRSSCHAPTVMLANFVATPIELSLIIFFLRFGEFITGGPHFPLTSDALKKVLTGQASREILRGIFNAAGLWPRPSSWGPSMYCSCHALPSWCANSAVFLPARSYRSIPIQKPGLR